MGSGAKQQPRPNVSGQAHAFSFWSSSPMSKIASSENSRSEAVCSLASRAAEEPRAGPGAGASSGAAQGGLGRAVARAARATQEGRIYKAAAGPIVVADTSGLAPSA